MAPDGNVTQLHGQGQLRLHFIWPAGQRIGLAVIHHQAQDAFWLAVSAVLHQPLRVDAPHRAVGGAHAVAHRVATFLLERVLEIAVGRDAVDLQNVLDGLGKIGCRCIGVQAPKAQHLAVPAPLQRADVALPHAQAAEVSGQVEQFGRACHFGLLAAQFFQRRQAQHPAAIGQGLAADAEPIATRAGRTGRLQISRGALCCAQRLRGTRVGPQLGQTLARRPGQGTHSRFVSPLRLALRPEMHHGHGQGLQHGQGRRGLGWTRRGQV